MNSNKLDKYQIIEKIGEGIYGTVFKVQDKQNDSFYALKKVKTINDYQGIPSCTLKEIAILKEIESKYIVRLFNIIHYNKRFYLLFELGDMDLQMFVEREIFCDWQIIRKIIFQLLKGIYDLEQNEIVHWDIKPQNILLFNVGVVNELKVKVADFGLARMMSVPVEKLSCNVVTLWYRAPELLLGESQYDYKIDVWSVGCIFYYLITREVLFSSNSVGEMLQEIGMKMKRPSNQEYIDKFEQKSITIEKEDIYGQLTDGIDSDGLLVLQQMLQIDPKDRKRAEELLMMPYFDQEIENDSILTF